MIGTLVYRRSYTPQQVARSVCRFAPPRGRMPDCERFWTEQFSRVAPTWERRRVELSRLRVSTPFLQRGCDNDAEIAAYARRRRSGGRFPPVVLAKPWGDDPSGRRRASATSGSTPTCRRRI